MVRLLSRCPRWILFLRIVHRAGRRATVRWPKSVLGRDIDDSVRLRLEHIEAVAREGELDVQAQHALRCVALLRHRHPLEEAIARYTEAMELSPERAELVRTRALAQLDLPEVAAWLDREPPSSPWALATRPRVAWRWWRRRWHADAEEAVWLQLVVAQAEEAIVDLYARHAEEYDQALPNWPPTETVALFVQRVGLSLARARSVALRALARLAEAHLPEAPPARTR